MYNKYIHADKKPFTKILPTSFFLLCVQYGQPQCARCAGFTSWTIFYVDLICGHACYKLWCPGIDYPAHCGNDYIHTFLSSYVLMLITILRTRISNQLQQSLFWHNLRKATRSMAVQAPMCAHNISLMPPFLQTTDDSKITDWADKSTGEFKRGQSQFRSQISNKPNAQFPAEKGRYHLYVSYACPWGKSRRNNQYRYHGR